MSVANQAYIFLWSVIGGMLIAFIYDAFRIKRKAVRTRSIIIYIEDLLYWIIVAVVMFFILFYSNEGEIRGYIFIGAVLGVILYILLLSKIIIGSAMFVIKIIYKILSTVWKILTYPFKLIYRILSVPGRFIWKYIRKIFSGVKRTSKSKVSRAVLQMKRLNNIRKKI